MASFATLFTGAMIVLYLTFKSNVKEEDLKDYKSPYFDFSDMFRSSTATNYEIDNTTQDEDILLNIRALLKMVVDPAVEKYKQLYGGTISINSGYRTTAVNQLVNGAINSQHLKGEAVDLTTGSTVGNKNLYSIIRDAGVYDQLINENNYSWVHVSYKRIGYNRTEQLSLL